jgi:hypothetical protein
MLFMAYPSPTPLYHITAIDNLKSIAQRGAVCCKNLNSRLGVDAAGIAYEEVQQLRAEKKVQEGPAGKLAGGSGPGGNLHDYAPLYFAPRSPMLLAIHSGVVPGCDYRQNDIVHLVTSAQTIKEGGHKFIFTDMHAVKTDASFFDDLTNLDKVDWALFFEVPLIAGYCRFWQNRPRPLHHARRKEKRSAEFLVHEQLPIAAISDIGVSTKAGEAQVRAALAGTGWSPTVKVVAGWYY